MLAAAEFRRQYVAAVDSESIDDFRRTFASYDFLLIDRLDELKGSKQTQVELLLLIDHFQRRVAAGDCRNLIVTMDNVPSAIPGFSPQLVSRLNCGLVQVIQPPGKPARRRIIESLITFLNIKTDSETIDLLSEKLNLSAPDLFDAVNSLEKLAKNNKVDLATAKLFLSEFLIQDEISISDISKRVAKEFDVKLSDIRSNTRRQMVVDARAVAMYLVRRILGLSYQRIGDFFGKRDHSTVRHSTQQVEIRIDRDISFANLVKSIEVNLTA